jgi:hypothetical protein
MPTGTLILLLNCALVTFVARRLATPLSDMADRLLAVLLLIPLQIIIAGLTLGYTGCFSAFSSLLLHGISALAAWRFLPPAKRFEFPRDLSPVEKLTLSVIGALSSLYLVTALLGQPLIHDGLTYRLSRIGHWLQDGSIWQFPTNELRQSYHPFNVDLVMMWLIAPFKHGYQPSQLAQTYGGCLLAVATAGIARECGFSRAHCLIASALLFGMPNVCVQWSTTHSDLLTAGFLWSGLYFLIRSPDRPLLIPLAWAGVAMAIGAKGTVFYLMIGLAAAIPCLPSTLRIVARDWRRHALAGFLALGLLAAPRYLENLVEYGNPFAPESAFSMNHGSSDEKNLFRKTGLNLLSYLSETLEPASNPPLLRQIANPAWETLVSRAKEPDSYSNTIFPRHSYLREFGAAARPTADTVSSGITIPLLALLGAFVLIRQKRDAPWRLRLALVVCCAVFLLAFSALFLWWPTSFRYFTLIAPPLVILASNPLRRITPIRAGLILSFTLLAALDIYPRATNSGLAQFKPSAEELPYALDGENQADIVNKLVPPGGTLAVILPWNQPLAGFYRQTNSVRVELVREQDLQQLPDADYLRQKGWSLLVSPPLPIPAPAAGMRYLTAPHRLTGEAQYLVHLPR